MTDKRETLGRHIALWAVIFLGITIAGLVFTPWLWYLYFPIALGGATLVFLTLRYRDDPLLLVAKVFYIVASSFFFIILGANLMYLLVNISLFFLLLTIYAIRPREKIKGFKSFM